MITGRNAAAPLRAALALAALAFPPAGTETFGAAPSNPDDPPTAVESDQVFERLDPSRPPALGPEPAKVVVLVFSDFQCPVCRRCAKATRQIAHEFPGDVRVEFWQNALAMHANAENAAVAALAAQRQGKFWEYHDALFENQRALDAASLAGHAGRIGLDMEQFRRDYDDPALRARAKDERAVAEGFGARATPAFMINGKLDLGWGSWASFRGNVEREVAQARKLESAGTPAAQIAQARAKVLVTEPERLRTYLERVLAPPKAAAAKDGSNDAATDPVEKKNKKQNKKKKPAEN